MSKEEAIEILSEMRSEYNLFGDEEEATRYHVLSWAIRAMNAEPVRHGYWILNDRGVYECSVCGRVPTAEEKQYDHYCPNCGAKMDEVEEDDYEEPEINPCRGCEDYDGKGGCLSHGGCGEVGEDETVHG